VSILTSRVAKSRENLSHPLEEDMCHEILSIGDSDIGGQRGKSFDFASGEVARDQDRPSEEDRWQRSRDLANSEVRKVRAQELGAPSRESHENREEQGQLDPGHGRTVGSGTPSPIAHSGVRRLRGPHSTQKSRSAESRGTSGHVAEPQGGARVIDRWTRVAWRKESTLR
jgi:hypothetical protein